MNTYLIQAPVWGSPPIRQEPITVADIRQHANIDLTDDDQLLEDLIPGLREQVEETECWIQLLTATYERRLDQFPSSGILTIPRPPMQSLSSIIYTSTAGVETTWVDLTVSPQIGASLITVDTKSSHAPERGEVRLAYQQSWPSDVRAIHNSVKVRYVCGFGAGPQNVPWGIRRWMIIMAATMYRWRERDVATVRGVHELGFVDALLDPYRARLQ
jgi:uncharacterized phiE125 gp8 family phage protein